MSKYFSVTTTESRDFLLIYLGLYHASMVSLWDQGEMQSVMTVDYSSLQLM